MTGKSVGSHGLGQLAEVLEGLKNSKAGKKLLTTRVKEGGGILEIKAEGLRLCFRRVAFNDGVSAEG